MIQHAATARYSTRTARPRANATSGARRRRSGAEREELLAHHIGLVHHVARKLAGRLSTAADLDEMVSAGSLGLIQAVDSFDRSRGLSFSTYAVPRIRGAILDELRRQDSASRNVRRRGRELARARESLVASLNREPTHAELSRDLAVPAETLHQWKLDVENASLSSLDQPMRESASGPTLGDTITDDDAMSLDDRLTREQEVERLKRAIETLREQERTVLALNFFEELKLQEIADVLGLSVCRISQIRSAALAKLRVSLSALRAA
jgi:RNA polymerase sigma factor for flagellar operon FliA